MHSGIAVVTMMGEWDGDGNKTAEYDRVSDMRPNAE